MSYELVVTSHLNPNLSGVAKFNVMLADLLGVDCAGYAAAQGRAAKGAVLLSVKLVDGSAAETAALRELVAGYRAAKAPFDLFLHTFDGLEIEYELIESCRKVYAGNAEIAHALEGIDRPVYTAWAPALLNTEHPIHDSRLNLFSFGMAHKIQVKHYRHLKDLLAERKEDYSLWVSTAFHEKSNFGDFNSISRQMADIFGGRIQFLGFLSDEVVTYFLKKSHLFVSFFSKGVRANNTSVCAAMLQGCAVLTNMDDYSPYWMRHGENVLDIHRLEASDLRPERLRAVGEAAKRDASRRASWDALLEMLRGPGEASRKAASAQGRR